jgi:hypothetical protein
MVCGFYDGYSENFEKLETEEFYNKILTLNFDDEKTLLPTIFLYYKQHVDSGTEPRLNCDDGYNSGTSEAIVLAYTLKFNLFIVNMNNGKQMLSEYYGCGSKDRPTIIIVKRNGAHWDVFYPNKQWEGANLIDPLSIAPDHITNLEKDADKGYQAYAAAKTAKTSP